MHGTFTFSQFQGAVPRQRTAIDLENTGYYLDCSTEEPTPSTPPWADTEAINSPLPYWYIGDIQAPVHGTFTLKDRPNQHSCDLLELFIGGNTDSIDQFALVFSLKLYLAVHTREDVNSSFDVYTQRAEAYWIWNGSGAVVNNVWQGAANNNNSGDQAFNEVVDGSVVPVTTGPIINSDLLIDVEWITEP